MKARGRHPILMPLLAAMPMLAATVLCADRQGGAAVGITGSSEPPAWLFREASRPLAERVADLLGRMTLSEKISQMKDVAAPIERLFGDYNPAGRLPVTFYRSLSQLPPFEDYSMRERTYRFFTGGPLYSFGYGLSYTRFGYENLRVSPSHVRAGQSVGVSVDVSNRGPRAGDEVVQLYVSDVQASVSVAIRSLQGFERVHLVAGETRQVSFTLTPRNMALIDDQGRRVVAPGEFKIAVGGRQPGSDGASTSGVVEGRFMVGGKPVVAR